MRTRDSAERTLTTAGKPVSRWMALGLISMAELLVLSVWFSASAVSGELTQEWHLSPNQIALLTSSVQVGFVVGALLGAIFALPDRRPARGLFVTCSIVAAAFTALFAIRSTFALAITLRFLTGVALAGVYPVAVKLLADWFPNRRGIAVGVLIGALTIGSALPHLIVFFASLSWQLVIYLSAALALLGACIVQFFLPDAPTARRASSRLSLASLADVLRDRPVMLANVGYWGHMWELYAMWTWFPTFVGASVASHGAANGASVASIGSFMVIGVAGSIGCVLAGFFGDRWGRTTITSVAMAISGACAVTIGLSFGAAPELTLIIGLIWGASIVADSAQFSAAVTELCEPEVTGTALTFQMAAGFAITFISINLVPWIAANFGWNWAFAALAPGPLLGIVGMQLLRRDPNAVRIAHGRR